MTVNTICIDGKYYDTEKLAKIHPGGDIFVMQSSNRDGTTLYNSSHRRPFNHAKYTSMLVPNMTSHPDIEVSKQDFTLYFELCEKVKPLIKNKGFAPMYFYAKAAFLLLFALFIDVVIFSQGRTVITSLIQGLLFALIGLGIQHDANHGSISKDPKINRALGMSQDFIGGSALNWMISHNTDHHVYCNDEKRDCDLRMPMLRLKGDVEWAEYHTFQQIYYTGVQFMFGLAHILGNMVATFNGPKKYQAPLVDYFKTHQLCLAINIIRLGGGFLMEPSLATFSMLCLIYVFGGFYLAFFFFISHNFDGVRKEDVDALGGCFLRHQTETSSNVCGWWLGQINGGLNFQIEHHLFPRVHSTNYVHIAPVVRAFCEKHDIQYAHFATLAENSASVYRHLEKMGKKPKQ